MKIAICDDSSIFREQLHKELREYFCSLDVSIQPFSSGEALLQGAAKTGYDIIFLDIEMEGIDGLETARQIRTIHKDVPIILITSHTELAMEGYEVQAFRFLGKPLERNKLIQALADIEKQLHDENRISISVDGIQKFILCKNIKYIKSENVYLNIVLENNSYLIRKKIKEMISELPGNLFISVHRSYVVNLMHIDCYDGKTIIMNDGTAIPIARGNRDLFKQKMLQYLKEK